MHLFRATPSLCLLFLLLAPALHAQPLATTAQNVSVAIPVYEAVESHRALDSETDDALRVRAWTETVRFVTNRPSGSTLYVSVEGELNGGTLTVEPVAGSQVIHQHQPVWSNGTTHAASFDAEGEQVLVSGLNLVLASMDVRIQLTPGTEPPGPLRIAYRVGE